MSPFWTVLPVDRPRPLLSHATTASLLLLASMYVKERVMYDFPARNMVDLVQYVIAFYGIAVLTRCFFLSRFMVRADLVWWSGCLFVHWFWLMTPTLNRAT